MLDHDPLWYKDAIIYEVHVRAFHDSDGDGKGDFRGLTEKLDYLEDLGVTAVWLLPFYPSPLRDDGYDIADYTSVHPHYGNLRDFQEFLEAAHQRGIRVITELVINHTSDANPWFQRARLAPPGSPERDFYVWSDTPEKFQEARIIFKDFERSNWTWDPVAKAYYWHRFYSHQPDLNYDNPAVWDAIFPVVDFWLGMGVDGMRLDAVPYLYEREGTNCENLPETHAFLRALRSHVDGRFPNRMLLAEANQWPEDAVAYFGTGNECHMCFHFPVMPRLFMALHREDRFPILDILDQTPAVPENCQWSMFLRNHDELTLEMVTDEERDYMYRAYASDPQARINLGIRRRLAPLLRDDRRRIELMNALLFSMPGTPVLYYGDEIGMGDNIYLGDRNGVRTPMQWSGDRNAGFSRANPQRLYLPVIIDPEYHYEAVNVEALQNNPSSLLWWTKRLIALRKQYRAFGRGSLEFLLPDNPKILAFVRKYHEENILVVANLSRFVQHVDLDLRGFQGRLPEELFGRSRFPVIGDRPYPLSLGPHSFYWFSLTAPHAGLAVVPGAEDELPVLPVRPDWTGLFQNSGRDRLEALLPAYLSRRHVSLGRPPVKAATITEVFPLRYGNEVSFLTLVRMEYHTGLPETDLLGLTFIRDEAIPRLLAPAGEVGLARLSGAESGVLCDALADPAYCQAVLGAIVKGKTYSVGPGELAAVPLSGLADLLGPSAEEPTPVLLSEHSNGNVAFGGKLILKVFYRIEEGVNPDLEVGRFLTERQHFRGAAPVVGMIVYRRRNAEPTTLAVLRQYIPNQGDAWQLSLDQLSAYYERVLALPRDRLASPPPLVPFLGAEPPEAGGLLHELIGPYLETARLLGQRTAEMHRALSADKADPLFAPEPFGRLYQRSMYQGLRNLVGQVCFQLNRRMEEFPEGVRPLARLLWERHAPMLNRFRDLLHRTLTGWRIRVHGDYHLGHLLNTGNDFVVIDFEGAPHRSISERRIKRSPLLDVGGLVRSFHYATFSAVQGLATARGRSPGWIRPEDRATLQPWADCWASRVAQEFVASYFAHLDPPDLVPEDLESRRGLLDLFVLEKALEEIAGELERRPDQVVIPLLAVQPFLAE
jgi:maltose alpha-D-glucosyltransferase/alpha-amylase